MKNTLFIIIGGIAFASYTFYTIGYWRGKTETTQKVREWIRSMDIHLLPQDTIDEQKTDTVNIRATFTGSGYHYSGTPRKLADGSRSISFCMGKQYHDK